MPRSKPDAAILLQAAIKYLEEELMPTLAGYHRFQTRVTVNVLAVVRRELELGERQASDERERLAAMLGHEGAVEELNSELVDAIRSGTTPLDDPGLRNHVRQSLAEALAINNPKWAGR
jgi:hypothetical protein